MSHTFDSLQHGIQLIVDNVEPKEGKAAWVDDLIIQVKEVIEQLHDISHAHEDWLNHGPRLGRSLRLLDTCIKYPDDDERLEWIRRWVEVYND